LQNWSVEVLRGSTSKAADALKGYRFRNPCTDADKIDG